MDDVQHLVLFIGNLMEEIRRLRDSGTCCDGSYYGRQLRDAKRLSRKLNRRLIKHTNGKDYWALCQDTDPPAQGALSE